MVGGDLLTSLSDPKGRALAELVDHLGKLAQRGEAFGQRAQAQRARGERKDLAWKTLAQQLGTCLASSGSKLRCPADARRSELENFHSLDVERDVERCKEII